jgi:hypothetical protein
MRGGDGAFRTMDGVGILELNRHRPTPIAQGHFLKDFGQGMGFKHREIPALFPLA